MIDVSDSTRSGCSARERLADHAAHRHADHVRGRRCRARRAARPCHRPCRRACSSRSSSRRAISCERVRHRRRPRSCVERPMSRLSKRITKKPRSASMLQKRSSQPSICTPSPMIRSTRASTGRRRSRTPARCRWSARGASPGSLPRRRHATGSAAGAITAPRDPCPRCLMAPARSTASAGDISDRAGGIRYGAGG